MAGESIRTIAVTTGRRRPQSRLSRLRVRYPDPEPGPRYDLALARELLARAGELPASKHGLMVALIEYRRALAALLAKLSQEAGSPS